MHKKIAFIIILLITLIFIPLSINNNNAFAYEDVKISNITLDSANNFIYLHTNDNNNPLSYKKISLKDPFRSIIDVNNAVLIGKKQIVELQSSAIKNIKIAQFSVNPNIVRMVFTADSEEELNSLKISNTSNSLIVKLIDDNLNDISIRKDLHTVYKDSNFDVTSNVSENPNTVIKKATIEEPNPLEDKEALLKHVQNIQKTVRSEVKQETPKLEEKEIISKFEVNKPKIKKYNFNVNSINFIKNHINITGTGNVAVKAPFTLTNPTRIVFDLPFAGLENKEIVKNFSFENGDTVRIGQFEEDTLRLVINTETPNLYNSIISPDLQTLLIAQKNKTNYSELPNSSVPAQIKSIDIRKINEQTTIVTLISTKPMIHNVERYTDRLKVDLYNVNAPIKSSFDRIVTSSQFTGLSLKPIDAYPQGSSWHFMVDKRARIEHKFNVDGMIMQITIKTPFVPVLANFKNVKGKVVIDPGHGGYEPGAIKGGIEEKDINLDVAKRVKHYLRSAGVNVIMTRENDDTLSLKQRTEITNQHNPDAFVSIHVNAAENSKIIGLETHWYKFRSKKLADIIHEQMISTVNSPDRGIFKSKFYVIHHTEVPAVLAEIGFMTNEAERYDILTERRKDATARSIANGILLYLSGNKR